MKIICQALTGSRSYELDTISSDFDYVGVFLNSNPSEILGLDRFDFYERKYTEGELSLFEFRHFLNLLEHTNTTVIELLFTEELLIKEKEFEKVREQKYQLINSEKFFCSLNGYIKSEKKSALGEKRNQGQTRKFQIEKYGFSPKNFSHLFRLCNSGIYFFERDFFPISFKKIDKEFHNFIFSIKNTPKKHTKEELINKSEFYIAKLNDSFENRRNNYFYNHDLANDFCLEFYSQFLGRQSGSKVW